MKFEFTKNNLHGKEKFLQRLFEIFRLFPTSDETVQPMPIRTSQYKSLPNHSRKNPGFFMIARR